MAFSSFASTLVVGDTNNAWDVFVHNRETGQTTRVSVSSNGGQGNGESGGPVLSADGRYVAFSSHATNLVPGDTNGVQDCFVHDRQTGYTKRISCNSSGVEGNNLSDNPALSANGHYVAYESWASNLVAGDTNSYQDAFVHDLQTGQTIRVSISSNGEQGNGNSSGLAICADGRYVAFTSTATNLVIGDTNNTDDFFVFDRQAVQTIRVSVSSSGEQGNASSPDSYLSLPALSQDGRYVVFQSRSSNLVPGDTNDTRDVFLHDLHEGQTTRISVGSSGEEGNDWSENPTLSADGRYVAFESRASNLVPGDTNYTDDVFVHDRNLQMINKPDLWIRKTYDTTYAGNNIINITGAGQTRGTYANPYLQGQFIFRIQNDGNVTDSIKITAPPAPTGWVTKYYRSPSNTEITAQVTSSGWVTPNLTPGTSECFYLMTRPLPYMSVNSTLTRFVTAASVTYPAKTDVVKTMTVVNAGYQPDMWIRKTYDTGYAGDNIINTTGVNQTRGTYANPSLQGQFIFRVQNDGNTADSFRVTTPPTPTGWVTKYYRSPSNEDITAQVTGAGWVTPTLARGASECFYLMVRPLASVPLYTTLTRFITAASVTDPTKKDLVKTMTVHYVASGTVKTNPNDGAQMVWVPDGTFTMGTEYGDVWWEAPHTQQVTLSGYWIYEYEVTVAQYRAFCTATSRALPSFPSGYSWTGKTGWADPALQQHPIVSVTWHDAKAYADWAGVSLPTEAQWEYAARGPAERNYPWGGMATVSDPYHGWDQTKCANHYNSYDVGKSTWPVGSFPAGVSWCGAHDLAGNVLEWCSDWYGPYSYSPVTNPTGPTTGNYPVLRGGSWYGNYVYRIRGAYRNYGNPSGSWNYSGFRCVSASPGM